MNTNKSKKNSNNLMFSKINLCNKNNMKIKNNNNIYYRFNRRMN